MIYRILLLSSFLVIACTIETPTENGAALAHPNHNHASDKASEKPAPQAEATKAPKPAPSPLGCPEGTFASDGWPGEYPSPVLQVNSPTLMAAQSNPCDTSATISCAVPAGLYHPWSEVTEAKYSTVGPVTTYVTLKELELGGKTLPPDTKVVEQYYSSEGMCGLLINGESVDDMCPSNQDTTNLYKELPNPSADFGLHQYVQVTCVNGKKGWLLASTLLEKEEVVTGSISQYGEVAPTPLPDGRIPFVEEWLGLQLSPNLDLGIPEEKGPFWVVATNAETSKEAAATKANQLRQQDLNAHIASLANYGSAKNKPIWLVYVGPWSPTEASKALQGELEVIKAQVPDAYLVTLGPAGTRKTQ